MCRHKGLRLRRYRRENAFLLEALAVGAPSVFRGLKSRATNLPYINYHTIRVSSLSYLAPPTIPTSNSGTLPRCRLVLVHGMRRRRWSMRIMRMARVHVVHLGTVEVRRVLLVWRRW